MNQKIWTKSFILLTLANFFICITYYSIISTLPIYLVHELHAGKTAVGVVLASYTVASVIIRPFTGFSLDKFGRRIIFLCALAFYSIFFCGYLVAASIFFLIILRFFQGLTWGVTTIAGSTIAVDITPANKRGEAIGYFSLSTTLGMPIGPVVGLFICQHFGYTAMFVAGIIISLISLICASFIHLPALKRPANIEFSWENLFDRRSIIPSLNLLVIMITYGGLISFIALFGREIGIQNTSLFFLVFAIGIASSRLAVGKAFDRNGPRRMLTICLCLLIAGFPFLAMVKNAGGFFISALVIGFGIGVVFPTFQAMVNNLADNTHRGAANSTLYTALDLGMGSGMVLMGIISQYFSISASFLVSAVFCVLALIIFRGSVITYYEKEMAGR